MKKGQGIRETKKPMTHDRIYKIMLFVTFFVAGAFLVINLIKLNLFGIVAIGGSMLLFAGVLYYLKRNQVSVQTKEFVTAIAIEFLIFIISMFSGASFSDDFILFLAAIGVAGLYMEPKFTKTQIIVALVLLVVMPIIHSDKMESVGQYILCYVMFAIASYLYYLVIRRGRSFIDIAREHTSDSEKLLWAMQEMGEKLEYDFNKSSERIAESTKSLAKGSQEIIHGACVVADSCVDMHDKIHETGEQIKKLNSQVKHFESALYGSGDSMRAMRGQLNSVNNIIDETSQAVTDMKDRMNEVAEIAEQLSTISFKTTLLSLNASVEASHAGSAGAGFAVVASEMKELSDNSDRFSDRVSEVVGQLLLQVENISEQFGGSNAAIDRSVETMDVLQASFDDLTQRFESLYDTIADQNACVARVDEIFAQLKSKVVEMKQSSSDNNSIVEQIIRVMDDYRASIDKVIENTKR
ncbi:MAG: hypothetical protein E7478_08955 [Ruminococcaceae bacterium]|nr:hypothetical protein [Oscillospiraceae bacterium]